MTLSDLRAIANGEIINEAFTIKGLINRFKSNSKPKPKEEVDPPKPVKANVVATNFKRAYDEWMFTMLVRCPKNTGDTPETICSEAATNINHGHGRYPKTFMFFSVKDFNKEYDLKDNARDEGDKDADIYMMCFDYHFLQDNEISRYKSMWNCRFFNDVVDNSVRMEMDSRKEYKPKSYIDMGNIEAARKYLEKQ